MTHDTVDFWTPRVACAEFSRTQRGARSVASALDGRPEKPLRTFFGTDLVRDAAFPGPISGRNRILFNSRVD